MADLYVVQHCSEPFEPDDPEDVITIEHAVRISHRTHAQIGNLLDRGKLPWYQRSPYHELLPGEREHRFTSLRAVRALPPVQVRQRKRRQ